ncbi:MAG: hypothetical protein QOJ98_1847, partial [Acidobacteriota bacterium]|nr:hypothetical protein [Acidobacteriota bacterium]
MRKLLFTIAAAILCAGSLSAQELSAEDLDRRRKALSDLLNEQWEYTLRMSPEFASILGDRRYNDQVSDASERAVRAEQAQTKRFLTRFEAIDTRAFSDQERLNRDLMVRDLRLSLEGAKFNSWQMPVNQMGGIHLGLPQLTTALPFATVKDYDDYIVRLRKFPKLLDDTVVNMRKGMAAGLMPPRFLLEKVTEQAQGIADAKPEESPFAEPLKSFPDTFAEADRQRIRTEVVAAIGQHIIPAYQRFATFVRDEYAPKGRTEVGVWSLPDGRDRYAFQVRNMTTTDMQPEAIHELGLREVARIEGEMRQIAQKLGFSDLAAFNKSLETNPAAKPTSGQQILDLYRKY